MCATTEILYDADPRTKKILLLENRRPLPRDLRAPEYPQNLTQKTLLAVAGAGKSEKKYNKSTDSTDRQPAQGGKADDRAETPASDLCRTAS